MQQIEAAVVERVGLVDDIELLIEWQAQARALEAYLRSKELQRPIQGAQRRVEARIGQLLGEPVEGRPEKTLFTNNVSVGDIPDGRVRHDFRVLAHGFEANLDADEWRKSRRALVSLLRQRLGLVPETPALPDGRFRCIVADPPWRLDTGPEVFGGTGERGHDSLPYEQMSLEEIASLDVESRAADDAHLYLWTTNKYVEQAYGIARGWGFKPSVLLVWCKKPRGIGLGDAYRLTTEFCLYARRGTLKEGAIVETTHFHWPRGKHSEKPNEFYAMVEKMEPAGGFLELFARTKREGWTQWGHEA